MGELELIRWIRSRKRRTDRRVLVGSGDDAAVLRAGPSPILFKTDSVIDGVHFDSRTARPEAIGHKAVARCLSDIGAMGCRPTFAVVALMIPRHAREAYIRRVIRGMERTAAKFRTAIVGGDISGHSGKLAISVALLGECAGLSPVRRSGARPGDALAVTGSLGGSILGKHLSFTPRVREGLLLNRRFELHAMIDISDGLTTDLWHVCQESGVGAVVREDRLPISPAARTLARRDGVSPLAHALSDGEDYELLFTLPSAQVPRLRKSAAATVIGEISAARGLYLERSSGTLQELRPAGWEYRFNR